jgi:hypothetical protein
MKSLSYNNIFHRFLIFEEEISPITAKPTPFERIGIYQGYEGL